MSGHTPGPWSFEYNNSDRGDGGCWYSVKGPNGRDILRFPYSGPLSGGEREKANARLCAAAPDLLRAAQGVLIYEHVHQYQLDALAYAIAKATGAAP